MQNTDSSQKFISSKQSKYVYREVMLDSWKIEHFGRDKNLKDAAILQPSIWYIIFRVCTKHSK